MTTRGASDDRPARSPELLLERTEVRDRLEELKRREGATWLIVPVAGLASALVTGGATVGEAAFVGLVTAAILSVVIGVFGRTHRRERRELQRRLDELEASAASTAAGSGEGSHEEGHP